MEKNSHTRWIAPVSIESLFVMLNGGQREEVRGQEKEAIMLDEKSLRGLVGTLS